MAITFMSKFNEITDNEFDYLVLESLDVDVKAQSVSINLIYPELKENIVRQNHDKIAKNAILALNSKANVSVTLTKSHFDREFFLPKFLQFIENFPSVAPFVFVDDIVTTKISEYEFSVQVKVDDDCYDYITNGGVEGKVKAMLASSYCEKVDFQFVPVKVEKADVIALEEEAIANYVYETTNGHYVVPQNVEEFVGKIIYDKAGYISDAVYEKSDVVFCGVVSEYAECERKLREGETEQKKFYKFTLTDPTGSIKCLYFPRASKNGKEKINNIVNLRDGNGVVVKGSVKKNVFKGNVSYDMFVNKISLCTVPEDEYCAVKHTAATVASEYAYVQPKPYFEQKQAYFFEEKQEPPKFLRGKTVCVFDLETTGFNNKLCKIIEIGAVKIVDGVITETFETFVNPLEPIEQRITEITSITDADVASAPLIEQALPDFYKFCEGCILVGHNVAFDYGFIQEAGSAMGIDFTNAREDTWEIAKKYVDGLKNYKLGTLAKHFNVLNEHAHRAIYDTIATAKIYIILAQYRENE